MRKSQKKPGCFGRFLKTFFILCVLLAALGSVTNKETNNEVPSVQATTKPTVIVTEQPTTEPTAQPVATSEIVLKHPELGEYGKYYTFNETVKKAEPEDKETIIQCFVPAGSYTVTYEGKAPWSFVYVYSEETVITDFGWEEPDEAWVSPKLLPGESCKIVIPEDWYINLQENDVFRLVADPVKETSLDQYITKFNLSKRCKDIILLYLPEYENFSSMEQDALQSYSIFMNDGTKYYLSVSKDKEPMCLQSAETDYESRTRYYDRFAE